MMSREKKFSRVAFVPKPWYTGRMGVSPLSCTPTRFDGIEPQVLNVNELPDH